MASLSAPGLEVRVALGDLDDQATRLAGEMEVIVGMLGLLEEEQPKH